MLPSNVPLFYLYLLLQFCRKAELAHSTHHRKIVWKNELCKFNVVMCYVWQGETTFLSYCWLNINIFLQKIYCPSSPQFLFCQKNCLNWWGTWGAVFFEYWLGRGGAVFLRCWLGRQGAFCFSFLVPHILVGGGKELYSSVPSEWVIESCSPDTGVEGEVSCTFCTDRGNIEH